MRQLAFITFCSLALISCSREDEANSATGAFCAAKLRPFDPKNMKHCVDACISCENGTTVTCTTSCMLKGAR
jgi:hypothetical protein